MLEQEIKGLIAFGAMLEQFNSNRLDSGRLVITAEVTHVPPNTCAFVYLTIQGRQVTPATNDLVELQRFASVVYNTVAVLTDLRGTT